jgi:hypothetical protein
MGSFRKQMVLNFKKRIKKTGFICLLLMSFSAKAAEKSPFDEIEYVGADPVQKKTQIVPDKIGYIRLGKSLYSDNASNNAGSNMGSLGIKVIYDRVSTGFEHSYHVVNGARYNDYTLTFGYNPEVPMKLKPGVLIGAGLGSRSNVDSGGLDSGIAYFYDLNLEVLKKRQGNYNLTILSGLKKSTFLISNSQNSNITDLYLSIGIGW